MNSEFKWGIIGTGGIAKAFANDLDYVKGHKVVVVGSRTSNSAQQFASNYLGCRSYASYSELVADPILDGVYIATPHNFHKEHTIMALNAGKPVLCEKPFAVNKHEVRSMIDLAQNKGLTLMEAMWTRHLPIYEEVIDWIKKGLIGEPKLVDASLGFDSPYDPESRLWDPKLAGGSLLDVGIYPLTLADLIYETTPENVFSLAELSPDRVDAHIAITLQYQNSALATLGSAINLSLPNGASILGESGSIEIPYFWCAQKAFTTKGSEKRETVRPHEINGFEYQIREVDRCLSEGLTQSPKVSWECALSMIQLMDSIRSEIGVSYPADDEEHDGI